MDNRVEDRKQSPTKISMIFFILIIGFCICIICSLVGFYFFSEQFKASYQPGKNNYLIIKKVGEDGSIFGSYQIPSGSKVDFAVTQDGFATFGVNGGEDTENLQVGLLDDRTARLSWSGITIDGFGELAPEEQVALDNLFASDLSQAIEMIPLDIACQGEDKIDTKQVAALLIPLQMRFKYQITDRVAEANRLIAHSNCNYANSFENQVDIHPVIQFSPSMPVPVVFGYFPFDGEGAIELPESSNNGSKLACPQPITKWYRDFLVFPETFFASKVGDNFNETGPCNAKCRGACGPDCILSNCRHTEERRCEKDEQGRNTGMVVIADVYDCGLHEGCIEHDLCYDACNAFLGCETWLAALCRHGWNLPDVTGNVSLCDETAINNYGPVNPPLWARGYGPQPKRETFIYPNDEFEKKQNLVMCPVDNADKEEVDKVPSEEIPEENKPEEPQEKQPAEKERQPMGPCDFMPPGARSSKVEDNQCIQQYSDQPGERLIQIWHSPTGSLDQEKACQSLKDGEFHIVMKEVDYGVCGYQVQPAVNGTPGILGYGGWSVWYYIDAYSVRVHTDHTYPASQAWIYTTAEKIEEEILAYLEGE